MDSQRAFQMNLGAHLGGDAQCSISEGKTLYWMPPPVPVANGSWLTCVDWKKSEFRRH
jgi:hypothetical protein